MHIYEKDYHAPCAEQKIDATIKAFKSYVSRKVQISTTNTFSFTYSESLMSLTFNLLCFCTYLLFLLVILWLFPFRKFMSSISTCDSMPIIFLVLRFEHHVVQP